MHRNEQCDLDCECHECLRRELFGVCPIGVVDNEIVQHVVVTHLKILRKSQRCAEQAVDCLERVSRKVGQYEELNEN